MGISTLQSYRGAQIFEAIGLDNEMVDRYFTGTPSRLGGIGLDIVQRECLARHRFAYPPMEIPDTLDLDPGGQYQWRRGGERHQYNPDTVAKDSARGSPGHSSDLSLMAKPRRKPTARSIKKGYATFKEFTSLMNDQSRELCTLRGLLKFKKGTPIND